MYRVKHMSTLKRWFRQFRKSQPQNPVIPSVADRLKPYIDTNLFSFKRSVGRLITRPVFNPWIVDPRLYQLETTVHLDNLRFYASLVYNRDRVYTIIIHVMGVTDVGLESLGYAFREPRDAHSITPQIPTLDCATHLVGAVQSWVGYYQQSQLDVEAVESALRSQHPHLELSWVVFKEAHYVGLIPGYDITPTAS